MSSFLIAGPLIVFLIFCCTAVAFFSTTAASVNQRVVCRSKTSKSCNRCLNVQKKMQLRVDNLERILDVESPNWRQTYDS